MGISHISIVKTDVMIKSVNLTIYWHIWENNIKDDCNIKSIICKNWSVFEVAKWLFSLMGEGSHGSKLA